MKKKILFICTILLLSLVIIFKIKEKQKISLIREKHQFFLDNSPFKETLKLSKNERKGMGIPPNKYYERQWELTMNPSTGFPEPEKVIALQKKLKQKNILSRAPGDALDNLWIERGPNNIGGRTRTLFFDPTDPTNNRVFAGGVSGGLWKTDNISTNGGWSLVTGLPTNLSITCFAIDPNDNTNSTWYLGSGEQSTVGSAIGRGVYKTTDAGTTWVQVLDIYDFTTNSGSVLGGIYFINDIVTWNNNGTTEIYVGVSGAYDRSTNPINFLGLFDIGLYRSTNGGTTWTKDINVTNVSVNDFEVDASGNLWLATTTTYGFGDNGGKIYRRNIGAATNFSLVTTIPNVKRTEIEASATNPLKFYVLAEGSPDPVMYVTADAFTSTTGITLPNDPDGSVPANDFTKNQDFYDLVLEADPNDDNIVYIGGINIHSSIDGGTTWNTISHWAAYWSTAGSLVHSDHHALTFHPANSNIAILGHDGGISYASDLSATGNNLNVIYDVDNTYNVTQFYNGDIAPGSFGAGDYLVAGAQDNGTQLIQNGNPLGPDTSTTISGGDGAYSFFDQVVTSYVLANYVYNNSITLYDYSAGAYKVVAENSNYDGDFINPAGLDSNLDLLYANGSKGTSKRIYRYEGLTNLPVVTRDANYVLTSAVANRATLTNALLTGSPTAFTISTYTTNSTTMLVGTDNSKLLLLTNANTTPTWIDITGGSFIGSISDVEFGSSENEIFVTMHNYGVISIWYSIDGGTTWSSKEGNLPDIPVKCILKNPLLAGEVIIGTPLGVWQTTNFGAASPIWTQSYNGMSDVPVLDLDLRTSDNTVLATTHGRGMFTGKFTSTTVLSTQQFKGKYGLKVFPTITEGIINIYSNLSIDNVSLQVYDINGRIFYNDKLNLNKDSNKELNFSHLSSGVYFMNLQKDGVKETIKFIKK